MSNQKTLNKSNDSKNLGSFVCSVSTVCQDLSTSLDGTSETCLASDSHSDSAFASFVAVVNFACVIESLLSPLVNVFKLSQS